MKSPSVREPKASSRRRATAPARRPVVLVTGLSGAGRNTALNALEDHGYVAVDNLPLFLVGDLLRPGTGDVQPLVLGIDVRRAASPRRRWSIMCATCGRGPI